MAISDNNIFDISGIQVKKDACIVIVKTAWNKTFTDELLRGCLRVFSPLGINPTVLEVPGAIEIGFAINHYAKQHSKWKHHADAFIALGCVIKGDTPHFDFVCNSVTQSITQLNLNLDAPVIFGVLTVLNEQQALERLGGSHGHKGEEAALTALQMIDLQMKIDKI